jgi:hypothetical protein
MHGDRFDSRHAQEVRNAEASAPTSRCTWVRGRCSPRAHAGWAPSRHATAHATWLTARTSRASSGAEQGCDRPPRASAARRARAGSPSWGAADPLVPCRLILYMIMINMATIVTRATRAAPSHRESGSAMACRPVLAYAKKRREWQDALPHRRRRRGAAAVPERAEPGLPARGAARFDAGRISSTRREIASSVGAPGSSAASARSSSTIGNASRPVCRSATRPRSHFSSARTIAAAYSPSSKNSLGAIEGLLRFPHRRASPAPREIQGTRVQRSRAPCGPMTSASAAPPPSPRRSCAPVGPHRVRFHGPR